jgi:spermidine synthase
MTLAAASLDKTDLLSAMKAYAIPEGDSGLWFIRKEVLTEDKLSNRFGKWVVMQADTYTFLYRMTTAAMHLTHPGATVMEDTEFELKTHLGFTMRAYGKVLVTGLGLGCVARGLLANPNVEHVTVIENSKDVLKLVAPHMPTERLTIIEEDAFRFVAQNKERFDCVWHDLWSDHEAGEPHLDVWHMHLLVQCRRFATHQGAWALRKDVKRRMIKGGFKWMG